MTLSATTNPTTKKHYHGGEGGIMQDLVLTMPIKANTNVQKGDFLKITSGYVEPCSATSDVVIGVARIARDNTTATGAAGNGVAAGAAGAQVVDMLVRGFVEVDAFIGATGDSYDDALAPFATCGLSGDSGTTVTDGQAISCGADPTKSVGLMMSTQAVPGTAAAYAAVIFVDLLHNLMA